MPPHNWWTNSTCDILNIWLTPEDNQRADSSSAVWELIYQEAGYNICSNPRSQKKPHPKMQPGPALPVTATDSTSNENLEAELPVLRPSYNTRTKSTKFKAVAYKLVQFSSHLLIHCLFIWLPDRGSRIVLWISWLGCDNWNSVMWATHSSADNDLLL